MSKERPGRPAESPAVHATRQMLDDLDALMARMLELPVNPEQAGPEGEASNGPPTLASSLTFVETGEAPPDSSSETSEPAAAPMLEPILPDSNSPVYQVVVGRVPVLPNYTLPDNELEPNEPDLSANDLGGFTEPPVAEYLPPLPLRAPPPVVVPPRLEQRSRLGFSIEPLVRCNQVFDRVTLRLGGLGRWLRSRSGRNWLGLTGLGLLALAGFLLMQDWMGWNW